MEYVQFKNGSPHYYREQPDLNECIQYQVRHNTFKTYFILLTSNVPLDFLRIILSLLTNTLFLASIDLKSYRFNPENIVSDSCNIFSIFFSLMLYLIEQINKIFLASFHVENL